MRAKKYVMACILFCTLLLCGTTVVLSAEDGNKKSNGEYIYKEVESKDGYRTQVGGSLIECTDGICLLQYIGDQAEVKVPDEIDGKPVTVIGSGCFAGNQTVTRVEIPENVIWLDGFRCCSNLKNISLDNGVKVIADFAFEECESMESIDLPDSVVCIGNGFRECYTFQCCFQLKEVKLSKNLERLGPGVFNYCTSLEKIVVPEKMEWIRDYSFAGCTALKEVEIQGNCRKIGKGAFRSCRALEKMTMPDSVTDIMAQAFFGCSSLKNIRLPKNLQMIYEGAFQNCSSLEEITIPAGVTDIGKMWQGKSGHVFSGCTSLKQVTINGKLQAVRRRTFEWCKALETVKLPASVTKIGEGAFIGCKSLETIKLPADVERICIDAFRGCGLKEITFPEGLQMVGRRSFANCEALKKIVFKGKSAKIGSLAFRNIVKKAVFDAPNTAVNIYLSRLTKKNTGFAAKSMKVV